MLSYDYFIQTHQYLLGNKRLKEAVDLCEYAISSAVWPAPMERQCEALCRWSLAETYFYQIGDAQKARESYTGFLEYVDNDWSMISAVPSRREVMEDMYVKACIDMGQLAISYDEYFSYIRKSEKARPLTEKQKQQMEAVEYNQQHGTSWCNNIIQLAESEASAIEAGNIDRIPCAVAVYSLFLLYPETDPPIDTLRIVIGNYSSCVCRLVGECILYSAAKNHPANPDNYRFIFEHAIDLVGEFLDDMETADVAKAARESLVEARSESVDKSNFFNYGYASAAPPNAKDFIPPLVLREDIERNLRNVRNAAPLAAPAGIIKRFLGFILSIAGIIGISASSIHGEKVPKWLEIQTDSLRTIILILSLIAFPVGACLSVFYDKSKFKSVNSGTRYGCLTILFIVFAILGVAVYLGFKFSKGMQ